MLNYRHLYYFWMVSKEGGFARAAERLDMAIQTVSVQVRELEKSLGHQLIKPAGRGIALTEPGRVAFARAEAILAHCRETAVPADNGHLIRFTLSAGVCEAAPGQSLDDALARADAAMYAAKRDGRDRTMAAGSHAEALAS